jgi:hypothetical protein
LIKEIYGLAEKQGLGRKDFAAVYQFLAGTDKTEV